MTTRFRDRNALFIVAALASLAVYWAFGQIASQREIANRSTTFSNTASGVKTFFDLVERLKPGHAINSRRPFFEDKDLAPFDTLVIASPKLPLSKAEQDVVMNWIRTGGRLVVAFHDETSQKFVEPFMAAASFPALIGEVPGFKNGETAQVSVVAPATAPSDALVPGETYEFYSRLRIADSKCMAEKAHCYVRSAQLGKGSVTVFLGLPPFANGLIGRKDNGRLSSRLALAGGRVVFDEYHLLLKEKTAKDLALDPAFLLPTLGLLAGLLLFFLAGSREEFEAPIATLATGDGATHPSAKRGFHQFNRRFLRSAFEGDRALAAACARHARFLSRIATGARSRAFADDLETALDPSLEKAPIADDEAARLALRLIEHHKQWLKSRGRTP